MAYNKQDLLCFKCMSLLEAPGQRCPHCGFDNRYRDNSPGFLPAIVLQNQYLVGMAMGRGGFGITYLGYDLFLDRQVAIKEYFSTYAKRGPDGITVMPYDADVTEEFNKGYLRAVEEASMMAKADDIPNAVQVYGVIQANGTIYIVMEYIEGTTLANLVKTHGRMNWRNTVRLIEPIMDALEMMHSRGLIHRDISPENIMKRGNTMNTVLLDFGATYAAGSNSQAVAVLHEGYAPWEQHVGNGVPDPRSDQYSLCATMYHLLTGERPIDASQRYGGLMLKRPTELGVNIPLSAENALMKGMSIDINDRFNSIGELRREIIDAQTPPQPPKGKGPTKNPLVPILIVVLVLAILVLGGAIFVFAAPDVFENLFSSNKDDAVPTAVPVVQTDVIGEHTEMLPTIAPAVNTVGDEAHVMAPVIRFDPSIDPVDGIYEISADGVDVMWDAVDGATKYELSVYREDNGNMLINNLIDGTMLRYTLVRDSFEYDVVYYCEVSTIEGNNISDPSAKLRFRIIENLQEFNWSRGTTGSGEAALICNWQNSKGVYFDIDMYTLNADGSVVSSLTIVRMTDQRSIAIPISMLQNGNEYEFYFVVYDADHNEISTHYESFPDPDSL